MNTKPDKKKKPSTNLPLHKYVALGGKPAEWHAANKGKQK